jgi:uncharacterized protein
VRALALAAALLAAPLAAAEDDAPAAEINPALFVVRDVDSTLYLYGTVHALPPGAPWSNTRVRAAIEEAGEVWTESDMNAEGMDRFMAEIERALATPSSTPLSQRLPPQHRARLRYVAKTMGQFGFDLESFDPWEAALLVMAVGQAGRAPEAGVDSQVVAAALAAEKPLLWLEEMGVAEFEAMPEQTQIEFLIYVLGDANSPRDELAAGEAMWARGDLDGLYEAEMAPMRTQFPALYAWIATARNTAWTERLSAEMDKAGVDFVAVGAAHLVGPESLVVMLQARGYRVERVGE